MDKTKLKKSLFISLLIISVFSAVALCHIDNKLANLNEIPTEQQNAQEDIGYTKAKAVYFLFEGVHRAFRPNLSL